MAASVILEPVKTSLISGNVQPATSPFAFFGDFRSTFLPGLDWYSTDGLALMLPLLPFLSLPLIN